MSERKQAERRMRNEWPCRLMAEVDGYVMVRHPHCVPFVMSKKDWDALPLIEPKQDRQP